MIVEVYMSSSSNELAPNGVNLKINRCDDDELVSIALEDDGGKSILPFTFDVDFEELKKAILKLEYA